MYMHYASFIKCHSKLLEKCVVVILQLFYVIVVGIKFNVLQDKKSCLANLINIPYILSWLKLKFESNLIKNFKN